jgi:phosphoserine aminotransferase
LIYAGPNKNIGPSGVVVVIIRNDLLERSADTLHTYMNYKVHASNETMYNTPATFGIYISGLVFKWLLNMGGLDEMHRRNVEKAKILYDAIDASGGYFKGTVVPEDRSLMNVTFRLPNEQLEEKFIKEASAKEMSGIKGHRSVGGIRASIYNAFLKKGVEALVEFMDDFKKNN